MGYIVGRRADEGLGGGFLYGVCNFPELILLAAVEYERIGKELQDQIEAHGIDVSTRIRELEGHVS